MVNQRKVWEEEKKALEERKKIEVRKKELAEEQAKEELQKKLEAAGSRRRVDRVDWMYQGPSSGQAGTTEEMEGYLLGKRRIDGLIKGDEHKKLEKQAGQESFLALQNANTLRDTAVKIREDPMLAIKRQEQAAYEALMNDPAKRRQLLALAGKPEEPIKKEKKPRNHRHHHRHHDDASDDDRRHKRRRRDDNDERGHRGHRSERRRSASPSSRRRNDSDEDRPSRRRRTEEYSRSEYRRRSPSPRERRRSPSPARRRPSPSPNEWRKSPSPIRRRREDSPRRSEHRRPYRPDTSSQPRTGDNDSHLASQKLSDAERERKLAEMQQNASTLDVDREKRLAALAEQEKADREVEDTAREKASKNGDRGEFMRNMHRQAGELGLADRIGRGRQGLQKDD